MPTGTIYKLVCKNDDKFYIGSTQKPMEYRMQKHAQKSRERPMRPVYMWMNRHGTRNITFEILESNIEFNNIRQLHEIEERYLCDSIDSLKCLNIKHAYRKK